MIIDSWVSLLIRERWNLPHLLFSFGSLCIDIRWNYHPRYIVSCLGFYRIGSILLFRNLIRILQLMMFELKLMSNTDNNIDLNRPYMQLYYTSNPHSRNPTAHRTTPIFQSLFKEIWRYLSYFFMICIRLKFGSCSCDGFSRYPALFISIFHGRWVLLM